MATDRRQKWLHAYQDNLAALYTLSPCITLCDLLSDGDHKLVIGDLGTGRYNARLRAFKGTQQHADLPLPDAPVALKAFYSEQNAAPSIAIASGGKIFIFKNLKPFYQFALPGHPVNETEVQAWQHAKEGDIDGVALLHVINDLKEKLSYSSLSLQSQRYLLLSTNERQQFITEHAARPLKCAVSITAMTSLKKNSLEPNAVDMLVVTTECARVFIVDVSAYKVVSSCQLPKNAIPAYIDASGLFDIDYRILIASRNGCIYTVKRGQEVQNTPTIQLWTHAVGMVKLGKHIIVGCTDNSVRRYTLKGRRSATMRQSAPITAIAGMEYEPKQYQCALVALDNRTIQIYRDTYLVDSIEFDDVPTSIVFGRFGREDGALIAVMRNGGLVVRLLRRIANFEEKSKNVGAPAAQSQKLNVPKKTKLFLDQTMRERENANDMHTTSQRGLVTARWLTSKSYLAMIDSAQAPISLNSDEMLKVSVAVHGFGPIFMMIIHVKTMSVQAITDVYLTFDYNSRLYSIEKPIIECGMMVPGVEYDYETKITCLQPENGIADDICCLVMMDHKSTPCVTAQVAMPVSEQSILPD